MLGVLLQAFLAVRQASTLNSSFAISSRHRESPRSKLPRFEASSFCFWKTIHLPPFNVPMLWRLRLYHVFENLIAWTLWAGQSDPPGWKKPGGSETRLYLQEWTLEVDWALKPGICIRKFITQWNYFKTRRFTYLLQFTIAMLCLISVSTCFIAFSMLMTKFYYIIRV